MSTRAEVLGCRHRLRMALRPPCSGTSPWQDGGAWSPHTNKVFMVAFCPACQLPGNRCPEGAAAKEASWPPSPAGEGNSDIFSCWSCITSLGDPCTMSSSRSNTMGGVDHCGDESRGYTKIGLQVCRTQRISKTTTVTMPYITKSHACL